MGIARERGLRTSVYRPGDITGTPKDGVWKLEDLISRSIVGCIQMGCLPEIEVNLHLTPVDYVAAAIIHIAFQSGSENRAFNLLNENLMPMKQFYRLLRRLGYPVEHLPLPAWREKLESFPPDENALRVLSCLFSDRYPPGEGLVERFGTRQAVMSADNTCKLLSGSGIACPPVDDALMERYLAHFAQCGYIPAPARSGFLRKLLSSLARKNSASPRQ